MGFGLLPNKQAFGFGYTKALLAATEFSGFLSYSLAAFENITQLLTHQHTHWVSSIIRKTKNRHSSHYGGWDLLTCVSLASYSPEQGASAVQNNAINEDY